MERTVGMKMMKILGILFLVVFTGQGMLGAEAPAGEVTALPEVKTYEALRHAISQARAESRGRVEKAVEQERVREAWEIGRLIDAHVLQHKERADYAEHVLERLAGDLGMSERELYYSLRFYRGYPILPHASKLSWSDYRDLLAVNTSEERDALAERASKENWNRARLRDEVRNVTKGEKVSPAEVLTAEPGIPYTYRIVRGPEENERVLDLGFSNYYTPAGKFSFKEGDIVTSAQGAKGSYELSAIGSKPEALYTYEIKVLEVIDGDTIKAVIDLGFGFRTVQTLRLRGIDAPEIETADGMESKKALEKMLNTANSAERGADSKAHARILIRTVKSDKYDRYLADLFINGTYINQKLVDGGNAVIVEE
ncbi:MAG: DUF1016 N-terminal domain-containing protein [Candidatus Omnitrophota bacterium]